VAERATLKAAIVEAENSPKNFNQMLLKILPPFWQTNSQYPSLHFKKVGKNLGSVRVRGSNPALMLKKATIVTGSGLVLTTGMKHW